MVVSKSAIVFLHGLIQLFDSKGFIFISMGIMIALAGWGVGKFLQGLARAEEGS